MRKRAKINSKQIDQILVDINDTMSAAFTAMTKSLATELVTHLEPLVEKHYQLNEKLVKALEDVLLNRSSKGKSWCNAISSSNRLPSKGTFLPS